jgi:hypothetical protein
MLFVKLIKVAFLLKDLDVTKHFNEKGCDVASLVQSLPKDLAFRLCDAVGVKYTDGNEVDATIGLVNDFFLPLLEQAKQSQHLPRLAQLLTNFKNSPTK